MLTIKNIKKVYRTGALVQKALGGVSLSLRDSEFVAILGASGSGKTTLLNIIGGLDRYDDGDLIINGVSTKRYTDRDWDSYRNHTVGFVFQSYNLIPHQTILRNVELALTISGIPSSQRVARAKEALEKVGLGDHIHKKPSQLSGGQMQRVAIARALVNDPDILLADEPTGALDSDTSIQVLDLLKEVARDRLVVMVTHNPELAEQYATRIVTLKDGMITSDSDPFEPEASETVHRNLGKASMSFFTALTLSFNNLRTKKARTILVAFAGSIGIIGIALILAVSTGANRYIRSVEEESLQSYPITITDTSLGLLSMYTDAQENGFTSPSSDDDSASGAVSGTVETENYIDEWRTITALVSGVKNNDLKSLRDYFESGESDIYDHVQALEYSYNLTPQIFKMNGDSYRQVNPDRSFSALGISGSSDSMSGLFSSFSSTDSFFPLPRDEDLMKDSYILKAGKWPEKYDECVLLLAANGKISDMAVYIVGLKDINELDTMIRSFAEGSATDIETEAGRYSYDDFLGAEFLAVPASAFYTYNKDNKVWTDRSSDEDYVKSILSTADKMHIVGVIQSTGKGSSASTNVGFAYPAALTDRMSELSARSDIVKAQLNDPDIDVFTGEPFGEDSKGKELSISSLFSVDEKAIKKALGSGADLSALSETDLSGLDLSGLDLSSVDFGSVISADDLQGVFPELSPEVIQKLFESIDMDLTRETLGELFKKVADGYLEYAADDPRADASAIASAVSDYLSSNEARQLISSELNAIIESKSAYAVTADDLMTVVAAVAEGYPQYLAANGLSDDGSYTYFGDYLRTADARARADSAAENLRSKLASMLINADDVASLTAKIASGYEAYADDNERPSFSYIAKSFGEYLATEPAKALIAEAASKAIDSDGLKAAVGDLSGAMTAAVQQIMTKVMNTAVGAISSSMQSAVSSLMNGMSSSLMSAFNFDTDTLSNMFKSEMSAQELRDLMVSLMSADSGTYESNLKKLGYADITRPTSINIYPRDFDSKSRIKEIISEYNDRALAAGDEDRIIEYTDVVDVLMGSVTVIVDVISYVLIAFVAISLIVSSIMIGVITYISVLERRKEIGILRAIGASKRNISQVFNAETFIIGTLAGLLGVGISQLLIIPINIIIHTLSNVYNVNAVLPVDSAIILVLLSIALTLIGGVIPSKKAANSDPVSALRSE